MADRKGIPLGLKIISIIFFILGLSLLLQAVAIIIKLFNLDNGFITLLFNISKEGLVIIFIILVLVGISSLLTSIGLWKLKNIARKSAVFISILSIFLSLGIFITTLRIFFFFQWFVVLIINLLIILYLTLNKEAINKFKK